MFNKIIIAALAFAITANGIRTTNGISMSVDASCNAAHDHCKVNNDCCSGWGGGSYDFNAGRYV